ncbi:hypothetical protein [Curtobacterium sp. MCBD17_040]|uniref:hypothetical protein n=1 Tax=Curtobacterium sp. MCBD17_040 TaxID=2175674 RepID=UPI000DA73BB1|nr:hypothetical protein [Curtobacterium sp. MCBD17_040]WIB65670.1 hypothetical protein DEI94_16245 [Curtobacterium sp. MCBD17_040]
MTIQQVTVEITAADVRDVLGFETGVYIPRPQSDRILRGLLASWQAEDEAHANRILAAISPGLAHCILEMRKPGGLSYLRGLLERLEDDGDDD